MQRRRNVPEEAACGAAGIDRRTHSNTTAGLAAVVVGHAGYPSSRGGWLSPGAWMRLMLLCCTWKDERMGEEEGKEPLGVRSRWLHAAAAGDAETAARPLLLQTQRMLRQWSLIRVFLLLWVWLWAMHNQHSVGVSAGCIVRQVKPCFLRTRHHVWMAALCSPSGHAQCSSNLLNQM